MGDDTKQGCRSTDFGVLIGSIWLMGWLFTIGWLGFSFWKAVLALIIWPYFIGVALR